MRTPAKQEAGADVTFAGVHGGPDAPSAAKPWSSVICLAGMQPLVPTPPHWPTRSVFHGALVASRLNSPVPSWNLDRENAARTTVFSSMLHASPTRGRKLAIPLYWS